MLSICTITRNDNYGFNLLKRAQVALRSMLQVADEVVVVDFNSENTPMLDNLLSLKHHKKMNHIVVTPDRCAKIIGKSCMRHFYETHARNIAINHALELNTKFIVSTNIEVIPPSRISLFKMLYRFNTDDVATFRRIDVDKKSVTNTLQNVSCSRHHFSQNNMDISAITNCGDFQLAHRKTWKQVKFSEDMTGRNFADTMLQASWLNRNKHLWVCDVVYHIRHGGSGTGSNGMSMTQIKFNDSPNFFYDRGKIRARNYRVP